MPFIETQIPGISRALADSGLIPKETRCIVLVIEPGDVVKVYYDCYAERPLLDFVTGQIVKANEVTK